MRETTTTTTATTVIPIPLSTLRYMVTFFLGMVVMELALEGVTTQFSELEALAAAVTLVQFGFCFGVPLVVSRGRVLETFPRSLRALTPYVKLSVLVFGATALATKSVVYVSYPTKVVFKSAKLIPTMVVSTLIHQKSKYGPIDYVAALCLCLGAAGYSFGSSNTSSSSSSGSGSGSHEDNDTDHASSTGSHTSTYGILLLVLSILCDSLVPNLQQKLMEAGYSTSSTPSSSSSSATKEELELPLNQYSDKGKGNGNNHNHNQKEGGLSAEAVMVNVNAVGFAWVLTYMLFSGSLAEVLRAALSNHEFGFYLIIIGLGLSVAVLAYTQLIKACGSVVAVAVATLRKVATMILSYVMFPKPILRIHVISGGLVLAGILISTFGSKRRK